MSEKEKELRIANLEYEIRKKERGLRILFKQKRKAADIIIYGEKIEKLQDELEELTGRREPESPSWPV